VITLHATNTRGEPVHGEARRRQRQGLMAFRTAR
jgi:hypothetical protein